MRIAIAIVILPTCVGSCVAIKLSKKLGTFLISLGVKMCLQISLVLVSLLLVKYGQTLLNRKHYQLETLSLVNDCSDELNKVPEVNFNEFSKGQEL